MLKLLVIDDEDEIIQVVGDFFKDEGFDVYTADTGQAGLKLIGEQKPDVVFLDLKLPDISGLEILKQIRLSEQKCKVIVNTGYVENSLKENAKKLGCDVFLSKPFNLIQLNEVLQKLIATNSVSRE